ncbi:MAG: 3-dehydroquinate synthase [Candidatus Omnitrophica bacterium]|nr:3-dehydroquinate synthase [Candidatus Omnitrophota bacterium]
MHSVDLKLKERSYPIYIGSGILPRLGSFLNHLKLPGDVFVITNAWIRRRYGRALQKTLRSSGRSVHFALVADSEKSKSLHTASAVLKTLGRWSGGKDPLVIAFGGGVVGDLAGFIASVFKRGIPYVHLPTSLLAQVDSAIGGKTAVDLPQGKNLVGAFYQPRLVVSDTDFIRTLKTRQIQAGLAEIIKYACIRDASFFRYLSLRHEDVFTLKPAVLEHIVCRCSSIKARLVSLDEREKKGLRTLLNFGHTIGHAIEAAGGYQAYNHGEAVALGMLAAAGISTRLKMLSGSRSEQIASLIAEVGLPVKIQGLSLKKIISSHYHDKKFIARRNRFVLLDRIGKARVVTDVPLKIIQDAVDQLLA